MKVYVDPLLPVHSSANWRWDKSCHLIAETVTELHAFAASLGIEQRRFHRRAGFPHYDLPPELRLRAVELGAIELSRREFVYKVRQLRPLWPEAV